MCYSLLTDFHGPIAVTHSHSTHFALILSHYPHCDHNTGGRNPIKNSFPITLKRISNRRSNVQYYSSRYEEISPIHCVEVLHHDVGYATDQVLR